MNHVDGRLIRELGIVHVELKLRMASVNRRLGIVNLKLVVGGKLGDDRTLTRLQRIVGACAGELPYALTVAVGTVFLVFPYRQLRSGVGGVELGEIDSVEILHLRRVVINLVELVAEVPSLAACEVNLLEHQRTDLQTLDIDADAGHALVDCLVDNVAVDVVFHVVLVEGIARHRDGVDAGNDITDIDGASLVDFLDIVVVVGIVVELRLQTFHALEVFHVDGYCYTDLQRLGFFRVGRFGESCTRVAVNAIAATAARKCCILLFIILSSSFL